MGATRERLTPRGLGCVELCRVRLKSQGVQPDTSPSPCRNLPPPPLPAEVLERDLGS